MLSKHVRAPGGQDVVWNHGHTMLSVARFLGLSRSVSEQFAAAYSRLPKMAGHSAEKSNSLDTATI